MGDVFKEQLVKKQMKLKDYVFVGASAILPILLFFIVGAIPSITQYSTLFLVIGVVAAYYIFSSVNVEYEYIFTNGELDIDAIYNKSKRKQVFTGSVKQFECFINISQNDNSQKDNLQNDKPGELVKFDTKKDFSSGLIKPNTYAFLTSYKGKRIKIIIEPNENMLAAMKIMIPSYKMK